MIRLLIFLNIFLFSLNAEEVLNYDKQSVLEVQKLIESEEKIAIAFEKYLLKEFKIPTLANLTTNEYLGTNFSLANRFGSTISFKTSSELKLKYAITNNGLKDYLKLLYNRDLYRNHTTVYEDSSNSNNSYTLIELKSQEAKNILAILNANYTIESTCSDTLVSKYCSVDDLTIRWYNSSSNWIEYNKKDFEKGNVSIKSDTLLSDTRLNNLPVGSYIFIYNGSKYVKLYNSSGTSLKILKVD